MQNRTTSRVKCVGTDATDQEYLFNPNPDIAKLLTLGIIPNVSIATHASNYITVTISTAAGTIATFTTNSSGGAAMTAGTAIPLTFTGTGKLLEVASLGLISVAVAKTGTGPAYDFDVAAILEGIRQ